MKSCSKQIKAILLALVFVPFVACQSKKKTADADALTGTDQSVSSQSAPPAVDSTAMSFDPTGSDSGKISGLVSIHFEYDRATLSEKAKQGLQANTEWLKRNTSLGLQIEGHCDNRGSTDYNLSLGEKRAMAVKRYMVGLGLAENRLTTISYGKEKLLSQGDAESDHEKNRRANFVPVSSTLK